MFLNIPYIIPYILAFNTARFPIFKDPCGYLPLKKYILLVFLAGYEFECTADFKTCSNCSR